MRLCSTSRGHDSALKFLETQNQAIATSYRINILYNYRQGTLIGFHFRATWKWKFHVALPFNTSMVCTLPPWWKVRRDVAQLCYNFFIMNRDSFAIFHGGNY